MHPLRGGREGATGRRSVCCASLVAAAVTCTPTAPAPVVAQAQAPAEPASERAAQAGPANDDPHGLVGCSKGCGDIVERTDPGAYTKLREMEVQMKSCSERGGPHTWQVHYTVPGFAEPWRRHLISGGPKAKACLEQKIAAIAWADGWSAKVVAWEQPAEQPPDDPQLAAVHALIERFAACVRDDGEHQLDAQIVDGHGSTMTTGMYVGDAACFRDATAGYVAPDGWRAEFKVKRLP